MFLSQVPDVQTPKEVPKIAEADETPQQKPKKLAGAVSLFGGLDPFADKKTLRSASKEEVQRKYNVLHSKDICNYNNWDYLNYSKKIETVGWKDLMKLIKMWNYN